jgi:hypothetical protein
VKAPVLSSWFGRGEIAAPPDIASAALRSDRFRLEREGEWRRLENIIALMERGGLRRITDADLIALPTLYRTAASSLAVARETSLDAATLAKLTENRPLADVIGLAPDLLAGKVRGRIVLDVP